MFLKEGLDKSLILIYPPLYWKTMLTGYNFSSLIYIKLQRDLYGYTNETFPIYKKYSGDLKWVGLKICP